MFWEPEKAIFGPEKDKRWIWGSKIPKPREMPVKQGQTSQKDKWPRYMDWPQIGPKIAIKQGKNAKRTNGTYLARPHPHPPPLKNRFWPEMGGRGCTSFMLLWGAPLHILVVHYSLSQAQALRDAVALARGRRVAHWVSRERLAHLADSSISTSDSTIRGPH